MRHSMVTCHNCGKVMVPRATYSRAFWGYSPLSNHCPFCLSENWHGQNRGIVDRMAPLVGLVFAALAGVLIGAALFKLQSWFGVEGEWPLLTYATYSFSAVAGYRLRQWFMNV
jgi:hypothetical protein